MVVAYRSLSDRFFLLQKTPIGFAPRCKAAFRSDIFSFVRDELLPEGQISVHLAEYFTQIRTS